MTALIPSAFRIRMALLFGLLSMLVGLPTYLYVSHVHGEQLIADRQDKLQAIATSAATVLAENLVERRREIELLAQTDAFRSGPLDSQAVSAALERLKRSYRHYSWIGLAAPDGQVLAATSGHLVGANVAARPWFSQGKQGPYVGDVHEAVLLAKLLPEPASGQPLRFIDVVAPVLDQDGRLRGVLGGHAYWQWAGAVLATAIPTALASVGVEVFIVDQRNEVIFPEGGLTAEAIPHEVARDLDGSNRGFLDWGSGVRYLTAGSAIEEPVPTAPPLGWRLIVRQPASVVLASVTELQRVVLAASLLAGLVFLVFAWFAADRISRPLERLTDVARRIERGEEEILFDSPSGSRELRRLARALGSMASTLVERKQALEAANRELEAKVLDRTAELSQANQELARLARTDVLTGLPNRMLANERLAAEFARLQRSGRPYCVLVVDIDFFKLVNDRHGHATGDAVLKHVAGVLRTALRGTDLVARTGGEEFLILLPETGASQALQVAEKLRAAVENAPAESAGSLTVSLGVAEASADDLDEDEAVRRADRALYRAKAQGRNRAVLSSDS
jgi:diguanylate cyclase